MSSVAIRRITTELTMIKKEYTQYQILNEDDLLNIYIMFPGPEVEPYQNSNFVLHFKFDNMKYPFNPPQVTFMTKIYHPNINENGVICLSVFQDNWTPAYRIFSVIKCIQSLLTDPNPSSPLNSEAARLYIDNRQKYNEEVKRFIEKYCPKNIEEAKSQMTRSTSSASAMTETALATAGEVAAQSVVTTTTPTTTTTSTTTSTTPTTVSASASAAQSRVPPMDTNNNAVLPRPTTRHLPLEDEDSMNEDEDLQEVIARSRLEY